MGILLIFIGFLFTLNPMVALVDVIPDFIGYALIFLGVNKLGMISPEVTDSVNYFKWAAVISLARFGTMLGSGGFDETMVLCMTMVFAVLEFGVMFFALPLLSDGISYLNIRYSGSLAEDNTLRTVGTVFFAARGFLSVLPELGALSIGVDPDGDVTGEVATVDWAEFSSALTIANILLTLVFAAFFITVLVKRIFAMTRDAQFVGNLSKAYEDKKRDEPGIFIRRRLLYAFSALGVGAFFLIDLTGDGVNFIPDAVFGLLSLLAVWLISPYADNAKRAYITGGAFTALSVGSHVYANLFVKRRYFMTFDTLMVMFPGEYYVGILLAILEGVALALYIRQLVPMLSQVAEGHVGLIVTDEFTRTKKQNESSVKVIKNKLTALFIVVCVAAASGAAFFGTLHAFPVYWMIHAAINIATFVLFVNTTSHFVSEINMRYEKPGE